MILKIILTLIPVSFLIQLFVSEYIMNKNGVNMGGNSPINKYLFLTSKYSAILVWSGMVLEIWDIHILFNFPKNIIISYAGIILWITGFTLLYIGRFSLGRNFRYGVAREKTEFIAEGIYKISRNPMYLGLFTTFIGCIVYSLNIIYLAISIFIIIVHHMIVLGEEKSLQIRFGESYKKYCGKVRRYI